MIRTPDGEPPVSQWIPATLDDVVARLDLPLIDDRPIVIAVDGRSASGKSTFGERLAAHMTGSVLLHTDDVAWWESFFGWDHLMIDDILVPARRGEPVSFRPPAWVEREREGSIDVPVGTRVVIAEGVGASRVSIAPYLDAALWVQSDYAEANRRGIERDMARGRTPQEADEFWWQWMAEEDVFLAEDRPWERAAALVCGTPALTGVDYDAETEVLVAG